VSDKPENGLWYASVGGNPTEVVRVTDDGWYSIGCADVHDFGGVEFIRLVNLNWWPVNAATKAKQEAAFEKQLNAYHKKHGRWPNYRRFP